MRVVVIGSGAMGLAAAWQAAKAGHQVTVLEAAGEPGGMAAHFDLDGLSIERYYHFICKTDAATFALLKDLGIEDKLHWRTTSMGLFTHKRLYPWGSPLALLRFPHISLLARLRYAIFAFVSVRRERWDSIETDTARDWITRWCGSEVYEALWAPLFRLKFYEYAENISAAWIWTRVKRIGRSRRSIFQEELGYLEGGSQTLVNALVAALQERSGRLCLKAPARRIVTSAGRVTGVETANGFFEADHVLCTVPTPLLSSMVPDLPESWKHSYESIRNIGICCLVYKLRKPVSTNFWVNISDPGIDIPGIVEFSNLRPVPDGHIVYVPYYMPVTHPKFSWSDEALLSQSFGYLQQVNPSLTEADILAAHVARLKYAQPICEPGFFAKIPPVETPITGLQIADTCFYYPEDRGISESIRYGRDMALRLDRP